MRPTWAPDFMWVMVGGKASAMATCCRSNASCRPCTTNRALKSLVGQHGISPKH